MHINILPFKGDGAHESLMMRSRDVLRTLIHEGYLNNHIITAIWEAGFLQRYIYMYICIYIYICIYLY
jgi:hypothetical protein